MMLFVLDDSRTERKELYQILGTDAIHGLRRCRQQHDNEVGMENVYRLRQGELYEVSTRFTDESGVSVREESRFYFYHPDGLRKITEDELPGIIEGINNAARVFEHPDGMQK